MVLDSLKGVAVPKSVRLMWQSTISMGKNFLDKLKQAENVLVHTFNCFETFQNKLKHNRVKIPDPIPLVSKH